MWCLRRVKEHEYIHRNFMSLHIGLLIFGAKDGRIRGGVRVTSLIWEVIKELGKNTLYNF